MIPATLDAFILRALRSKSPMTEKELILSAQTVFGSKECHTSTVLERLADLDTKELLTRETDPDGINGTTVALTIKGQHKAKQL